MYITESQSLVDQFLNRYDNPKTQVPYRLALKRFYDYLVRTNIKSLNSVTLELAESFKADLELDYSPKTCSMTITTIKEFFKFLNVMLKDDGKTINMQFLMVKGTKVNKREQKTSVLTEKEVKKTLEVAYNLPDKFQSAQYKITLLLGINAGLRLQEMSQMRLSHLSLSEGQFIMKVLGKGMRFRYITLSKPVTVELQKCFADLDIKGDDYLIQGNDRAGQANGTAELTHMAVFKRVKKIISLANINKDISPHSLRRTCATIMYKHKTPIEVIQRILGHENVQTTQGYIAMEADIDMSAEFALNLTGEAV